MVRVNFSFQHSESVEKKRKGETPPSINLPFNPERESQGLGGKNRGVIPQSVATRGEKNTILRTLRNAFQKRENKEKAACICVSGRRKREVCPPVAIFRMPTRIDYLQEKGQRRGKGGGDFCFALRGRREQHSSLLIARGIRGQGCPRRRKREKMAMSALARFKKGGEEEGRGLLHSSWEGKGEKA